MLALQAINLKRKKPKNGKKKKKKKTPKNHSNKSRNGTMKELDNWQIKQAKIRKTKYEIMKLIEVVNTSIGNDCRTLRQHHEKKWESVW